MTEHTTTDHALAHMDPFEPPPDLRTLVTQDGSRTLRSERIGEQYHSVHGAVQESMHVFIHAGLRALHASSMSVLEVGLGTGLNALLTLREARVRAVRVEYTALEPYPLPMELLAAVDHPTALDEPALREPFDRMMRAPIGTASVIDPCFTFSLLDRPVQAVDDTQCYDVIYFDAFGPAVQPDMWTRDVFERMHRALREGGLLVTYCAKGEVRRTMQAVGFRVERLPGPHGKREMLRAWR